MGYPIILCKKLSIIFLTCLLLYSANIWATVNADTSFVYVNISKRTLSVINNGRMDSYSPLSVMALHITRQNLHEKGIV